MKKILFVILLFSLIIFAGESFDFYNNQIDYIRPDSNYWKIQESKYDQENKIRYIIFKHIPLMDSLNQIIEPVCAIVCKYSEQDSDVVQYSIEKKISNNWAWDVDSTFIASEYKCSYYNGIVMKGHYVRGGYIHPIIMGYFIGEKMGIEIICDATYTVYEMVREEMEEFVRSIYIKEKYK